MCVQRVVDGSVQDDKAFRPKTLLLILLTALT